MENSKSCRCPHHCMSSVFLICLAVTLVLGNAGIIEQHTAGIVWPVFLALIGLQMLIGRKCKCCGKSSSGCCKENKEAEACKPGKCC